MRAPPKLPNKNTPQEPTGSWRSQPATNQGQRPLTHANAQRPKGKLHPHTPPPTTSTPIRKQKHPTQPKHTTTRTTPRRPTPRNGPQNTSHTHRTRKNRKQTPLTPLRRDNLLERTKPLGQPPREAPLLPISNLELSRIL